MPDGEGWLLRPVARGLCRYESLKDGTLDLCDIARMNEMLDVDDENRMLVAEFNERKNGR